MEILLSKSQRLKVPFVTGMKRVGRLDTTLEFNMEIKHCQHLKGNFTEKNPGSTVEVFFICWRPGKQGP